MKFILVTSMLLISMYAKATEVCSSGMSDIKNIKAITDKVDLFGAWKGEYDGKIVSAEFGKTKSEKFTGKVVYDTSSYGPYNIQLCDNGGQFSAHILFYEASFEVLSNKKISIELPINGNPVVTMTKISNLFSIVDEFLLLDYR